MVSRLNYCGVCIYLPVWDSFQLWAAAIKIIPRQIGCMVQWSTWGATIPPDRSHRCALQNFCLLVIINKIAQVETSRTKIYVSQSENYRVAVDSLVMVMIIYSWHHVWSECARVLREEARKCAGRPQHSLTRLANKKGAGTTVLVRTKAWKSERVELTSDAKYITRIIFLRYLTCGISLHSSGRDITMVKIGWGNELRYFTRSRAH